MTTHLFIFACTCEQKGKITFLDKTGNFLNGSSMCKLLFLLKKIKWCKVYIQCEESEVEVKKLPNKILMFSRGSISKLNSFTIGCNLHSSPRAWQYKVKVKVFMLTFITSANMNITFKTHLFHEDPLSKSVVQNILLPSISCLVIQGELNRRMSLLLHVQVDNDQLTSFLQEQV